MKVCIFSDIHGNWPAFEKMYETEKNSVDRFLFLGDIFGYFYGQELILDCFERLDNLTAIRGNHEEYYEKCLDNPNRKEELLNRYGSSYLISLQKRHRDYISRLAPQMTLQIDGKIIVLCHGGMNDPLNERIYPDSEINPNVNLSEMDYLLLGHTHYQMDRQIGKTRIINPGSLGQPRDGKGFSYGVLDLPTDSLEWKTVCIDRNALLAEVMEKDAKRYVGEYLRKKYS